METSNSEYRVGDGVEDEPPSILESPKAQEILEACRQAEESSNIDDLVKLAVSDGGLLHDSLRQKACKLCMI
jgi:hypothetical protein